MDLELSNNGGVLVLVVVPFLRQKKALYRWSQKLVVAASLTPEIPV